MEVLIVKENSKFIAVLSKDADLREWALNWIENDDQDIEFWEGGSIGIEGSEIVIWGDNGSIFLTVETHKI